MEWTSTVILGVQAGGTGISTSPLPATEIT